MREEIIIDPDCRHPDVVRHDILTRAHFQTRGLVSFKKEEDIDGRTILTVEFRDPLDADDFRSWLGMVDGIPHRDYPT